MPRQTRVISWCKLGNAHLCFTQQNCSNCCQSSWRNCFFSSRKRSTTWHGWTSKNQMLIGNVSTKIRSKDYIFIFTILNFDTVLQTFFVLSSRLISMPMFWSDVSFHKKHQAWAVFAIILLLGCACVNPKEPWYSKFYKVSDLTVLNFWL